MRIKVKSLIKAVENNQTWFNETCDNMDIERRTKERTAEGKKDNACGNVSILITINIFKFDKNGTTQSKNKKKTTDEGLVYAQNKSKAMLLATWPVILWGKKKSQLITALY